jgi:ribosomal protein S18 acetylase RimI-like enzyme
MWVAELPGKGVIGQLFVQLNSGRSELADGSSRGYIYGFRVQADYRGHGIGTRMMEAAEADLAERKFRWVTLNVGRDNPGAQRLYEKLAYRVVAAEPGDWSYLDEQGRRHDVHEPAWRMEKRLPKTG